MAHLKFSKRENSLIGHDVCQGHVSREGLVLFNGGVVRLSDEGQSSRRENRKQLMLSTLQAYSPTKAVQLSV